jgi:hypothetical protein
MSELEENKLKFKFLVCLEEKFHSECSPTALTELYLSKCRHNMKKIIIVSFYFR